MAAGLVTMSYAARALPAPQWSALHQATRIIKVQNCPNPHYDCRNVCEYHPLPSNCHQVCQYRCI
jgi:hypothetical protein